MSSEPLELALKYRPARFADLAGQRPTRAVLYRSLKLGHPAHAYLLSGERGSGKTTTARIVAKALNCEREPGPADKWPCCECASCLAIAAGNHPEVHEIDAASNGTVDEIRALRQQASFGSAGEWRVFILDEAHGISAAGFEALQVILEAPPARVVFILASTRPMSIPKPVRDRCHWYLFEQLPVPVILERLRYICAAEQIEPGAGLLEAIAASAGGGMRNAVMKLDQAAGADCLTLRLWRELTGEHDFAPALLAAAAAGDFAAVRTGLRAALSAYGDPGKVSSGLIWCLADVLALTVPGGEIDVAGEELESRRALAVQLGAVKVQGALQVMWELEAKVRTGDRAADLILCLSQVTRKLSPQPRAAAPIAPAEDSREAIARLRDDLGAIR